MSRKTIKLEGMDEFFESMEVAEELGKTYSSDVDFSEDAPLIEPGYLPIDDTEELYSEDEISAFLENINLEDDKTGLSFDQMMPKTLEKSGVQYQRKERKMNHFLVIRDLVKITPSVCTSSDCTYDAAKACGFSEWDKVSEGKKRLVATVLEQHRERKHKFVDDTIIDAVDYPGKWLSSF